MDTSSQFQHRPRSRWADLPQRPSPDERLGRLQALDTAFLPRARIQFLREKAADPFSHSTLSLELEVIPSGSVRSTYDRSSKAAFGRRLRPPAGKGLAAWQQVVVAAYIEKHIAESIQIRALARFVYLSSDCFCRAFKRSFGTTPHRYLTQKRIDQAKALLASSEWSITDIGLALGFRHRRSFSAAFRQVTGLSPTEYRPPQQ